MRLGKRSAALAVVVAFGLVGCTPSTGGGSTVQSDPARTAPATFSPTPRAPAMAGNLRVVFPADQGDYAALLEVFSATTGLKTEPVALPAAEFQTYLADLTEGDLKNQAVLGFDSSATGDVTAQATQVGRDYACVVADQSWFSVNSKAKPATSADLAKPEFGALTAIADPASSVSVRRWLSPQAQEGQPKLTEFLTSLKKAGVALPSQEARLTVDSALLPWRTVNNVGTESQWQTLPETCVVREVYLVGGELSDTLAEYLATPGGQEELLLAGVAYPLGEQELNKDVALVAPDPKSTVTVPADKAPELGSTVELVWKQAAFS